MYGLGGGGGLVAKSSSTPGSSAHGILQARILVCHGLPFLTPGDLPSPGIELGSPVLHADSLLTELQGKPVYNLFPVK